MANVQTLLAAYQDNEIQATECLSALLRLDRTDEVTNAGREVIRDVLAQDKLPFQTAIAWAEDFYEGDMDGFIKLFLDFPPQNEPDWLEEQARSKTFLRMLRTMPSQQAEETAVTAIATMARTLFEQKKISVLQLSDFVTMERLFDNFKSLPTITDLKQYVRDELLKRLHEVYQDAKPAEPLTTEQKRVLMAYNTAARKALIQELNARPESERKRLITELVSHFRQNPDDAPILAPKLCPFIRKAFALGDIDINRMNDYIHACLPALNPVDYKRETATLFRTFKKSYKAGKIRFDDYFKYLDFLRFADGPLTEKLKQNIVREIISTSYRHSASNSVFHEQHEKAIELIPTLPAILQAPPLDRFENLLPSLDENSCRALTQTLLAIRPTPALITRREDQFMADIEDVSQRAYYRGYLQNLGKKLCSLPPREDRRPETLFNATLKNFVRQGDLSLMDYAGFTLTTMATALPQNAFKLLETLFYDIEELGADAAPHTRANAQLSVVLRARKAAKTSVEKEWVQRQALTLGAELGINIAQAERNQLRELFQNSATQEFRTNGLYVWLMPNARRTPAMAYLAGEGEPLVDIFNLQGPLSEVRAAVEARYAPGHARRGIFKDFVARLG